MSSDRAFRLAVSRGPNWSRPSIASGPRTMSGSCSGSTGLTAIRISASSARQRATFSSMRSSSGASSATLAYFPYGTRSRRWCARSSALRKARIARSRREGRSRTFSATKTARDKAKAKRPGDWVPEIILPYTAHPSFDKAAHYLGMKVIRVRERPDFRADVQAMERAITERTVMIVGSAPQYPHGRIDPIAEIAAIATKRADLVPCRCLCRWIPYPLPEAARAWDPHFLLRRTWSHLGFGRSAQVRPDAPGHIDHDAP